MLKESLSVLLRSPDTLSLPPDTFVLLESIPVKEELHMKLVSKSDQTQRPFLYAEVSRLAYGIGLLTAMAWKDGDIETVENVINEMNTFVTNISTAWETCSLCHSVPKGMLVVCRHAQEGYSNSSAIFI